MKNTVRTYINAEKTRWIEPEMRFALYNNGVFVKRRKADYFETIRDQTYISFRFLGQRYNSPLNQKITVTELNGKTYVLERCPKTKLLIIDVSLAAQIKFFRSIQSKSHLVKQRTETT